MAVEKVTSWKATDGTLFKNEEDAKNHQQKVDVEEAWVKIHHVIDDEDESDLLPTDGERYHNMVKYLSTNHPDMVIAIGDAIKTGNIAP